MALARVSAGSYETGAWSPHARSMWDTFEIKVFLSKLQGSTTLDSCWPVDGF